MIIVSPDPINAAELLAGFTKSAGGSGGIVTFSGQVRPFSQQGKVKKLALTAYSPLTENGIKAAVKAAETRWDLENVWVAHRTGDMFPGDTIVFVAAASKHRRAAFEAADFLMDYLKTEAVFWKKEITENGQAWIEPRAEDYIDKNRWAEEE